MAFALVIVGCCFKRGVYRSYVGFVLFGGCILICWVFVFCFLCCFDFGLCLGCCICLNFYAVD